LNWSKANSPRANAGALPLTAEQAAFAETALLSGNAARSGRAGPSGDRNSGRALAMLHLGHLSAAERCSGAVCGRAAFSL